MLAAGKRDQRVSFRRATVSRSALGGRTADDADWAPVGSRMANVRWGTGAERRSAAVEGGVQAATFRCLLDSLTRTITPQDRIVLGELAFDIEGVAPIGNTEVEFTATASRG